MDIPGCLRSPLLAGALVSAASANGAPGLPGIFPNLSNIGAVSRPAAFAFEGTAGTYKISASGSNIWGASDAFGFAWRPASGDIEIAADIGFTGERGQGHRKACLMFRQSLDQGSPYADVAVHGDGHIALQFRAEAGGPTRTIVCAFSAPRRLRLERRGAYVTLSSARADGEFAPTGCAVRLPLEGSFLAGLAVCAHDNAAFETARFGAVEVDAAPGPQAPRFSGVEVLTVKSLERRIICVSAGRMEAPFFSPDGNSIYFDRDGKLFRIGLSAGAEPEPIGTGPLVHLNADHGLSPDGLRMAVCDNTGGGPSLIYLMPAAGGAPRQVEVPGPAYWHSWSPDGATLAYCAAREGNYDVYTIPAAGGAETRLTTAPANDNGPDYSADGKWIYFHSERTGRMQVWRMHADGSGQEPVTSDEYFNWFPHPSPDGRWIAILSSRTVPTTGHPPDGDYLLRVAPSGGGPAREVARFYGGNGCLNVPCWSKDSTRITYATFEPSP